ncbi:protein-disulfide reductase DsbD [Rodentibacter caecimuris]|uniref:Thiol:disulfide interchange protein DsbD n=1 Tax=Rodentibacter caecimuris TaxID=1796644 RepID=A0ABX3KXY0_9PAST|nr:protein-disulfide reductase DsbD [Rodentibacter heylii]
MKRIFLLFVLIFLSFNGQANLFNKKPSFLNVNEAFQVSVVRNNEENITVEWHITPGYYLYQDKLNYRPVGADQNQIEPIYSSNAESYQDPYFGEVKVFKHSVKASLNNPIFKNENITLEIDYQGCTEGFCYPPETRRFKLADIATVPTEIMDKTSQNLTALSNSLNTKEETSLVSEHADLANRLFNSKLAVFGFFLLGLGLAFTPCVLPMLPLLSAIVIGSNQRPNTFRALSLSFVYVQGMALTYTLLGLIVAAIGLPFQIALQSPYVLISLSVIFVLLALSMFGLFTLQLPSQLQTKLTLLSQQQKGGAFSGVFLMGMIAGLVASPCTSAPLSGALLYVAQSGDLLIGAITLYLLALGMGIPLILITVFGNKVLPKSGEWMNQVKHLFGFVMLALPIFLLSRILPEIWEPRLWAMLATVSLVWLAFQMPPKSIFYALRILLLSLAMVMTKPLQDWVWSKSAVENSVVLTEHIPFKRISTYQELQQALTDNPYQSAMLDLYADWCVACKEFEKYTFSNPKVKTELNKILLLQIDMSANSEENRQLMQQLNVMGLPTILFFNQQGIEIKGSRITGFMDAEAFLNWLTKLQKQIIH